MNVPLKVRQSVCRGARERYGIEWTPDQVAQLWSRAVATLVPILRDDPRYADCPDDPAAFREWVLARPALRDYLRRTCFEPRQ